MSCELSFDLSKFDFDRIQAWLSGTYWSPGISRERVVRGFENSSIVVGAFDGERQVGVARCMTDTTRFAYVADVFVDSEYRGRGLARDMVKALLAHPRAVDVDRAFLFTQDAHGVYQPLGFGPHSHPDHLMVRRNPGLS